MTPRRNGRPPLLEEPAAPASRLPEEDGPESVPRWLSGITAGMRRALGWMAVGAVPQRAPDGTRWVPRLGHDDAQSAPAPQAHEQQPTRDLILRHVEAHPGTAFAALCAALGIVRQTVEYHARCLERGGLLRCTKDGPVRRLYPRGHERGPEPWKALQAPTTMRLIGLIEQGIESHRLLARRLSVSERTVRRHLKELQAAGLLESTRRPRLAAQATSVLAALRAGTRNGA